MRILIAIAAIACMGALAAACSSTPSATEDQQSSQASSGWFSSGDGPDPNVPQLGVNGYLWRASLDTLRFMPLKSADPVGGVIITDWYADPTNPNEQVKVTVYISDRRLRADAVKVAVFRQMHSSDGWVDAQVNPDTASRLENAILARARQLHLATASQ